MLATLDFPMFNKGMFKKGRGYFSYPHPSSTISICNI